MEFGVCNCTLPEYDPDSCKNCLNGQKIHEWFEDKIRRYEQVPVTEESMANMLSSTSPI